MSGRRLEIRLEPEVLRWARERAGLAHESLAKKLGTKPERVREWETSGQITVSQADKLARHTRTPVGFLYLSDPVTDRLPVPDFRTAKDHPRPRPSPELLDTIHTMQRRQAWFRDELIESGHEPLAFLTRARVGTPVHEIAESIRGTLGLGQQWADAHRTWTDALRDLRERIEVAGIVTVLNGVVGNNTHRKLDPTEFRGFALVDEYAPLIFVNAADFKSAQMFTLVHELVHAWIGADGVSNFDAMGPLPHEVERFCNAVAAEVLVPEADLRAFWKTAASGPDIFAALARRFKVSTIVAARRALDLDLITRKSFLQFYGAWQQGERHKEQREGGSFWNNQNVRIGHRFGAAVVRAVREERLLYRDAYALTGLRGKTFDAFMQRLGADL